jgi:hypothetical protein
MEKRGVPISQVQWLRLADRTSGRDVDREIPNECRAKSKSTDPSSSSAQWCRVGMGCPVAAAPVVLVSEKLTLVRPLAAAVTV